MRRVMAEIRFDILAKFWLKLLSDPHVLVAINLGDDKSSQDNVRPCPRKK